MVSLGAGVSSGFGVDSPVKSGSFEITEDNGGGGPSAAGGSAGVSAGTVT